MTGILEVTGDHCMGALVSSIYDYKNAVVKKIEMNMEVDYIVTRNVKDYQNETVRVIQIDKLINLVEGEE